MIADPTAARSNHLLASLSLDELQRLAPESHDSERGDRVFGSEGGGPRTVVFPHAGVMLSVIRSVQEGLTVEVGVVGSEGASPLANALAGLPILSDCVTQVGGRLTTIAADAVRDVFLSSERFRAAALVHMSVYLDEVSQHVVCNRLHSIEQRLSKWLLVTHDRVGAGVLQLTHDFIAHMLGVHRPGVTIALNALAQDGAITLTRGRIAIRDLQALERRACECRTILRDTWMRSMRSDFRAPLSIVARS